jgi:hypothetical protein
MQGFSSPYFTSHTVSKLLSNTASSHALGAPSLSSGVSSVSSSASIDVLVAHDWPSIITEFSATPLPSLELSSIGSPPIDKIITETKPRYIFCGGGGHPPSFWEREPFTWADEAGRVSRFVGLGAFGGEQVDGRKQRVRVPLKLKRVCSLTFHAVVLCIHNHARSSDDRSVPAAC